MTSTRAGATPVSCRLGLALIMVTAAVAAPVSADQIAQPNILLVIADDQGADASRQFAPGPGNPSTPTVDALATTGLVFDNAWATPGRTTTRATIFTGKHGVNSGLDHVPQALHGDETLLQQHLLADRQTSNYVSAVFGKWHMGGRDPSPDHPNLAGIDHFAGNLKAAVDGYFDWTATVNGRQHTERRYHTSAVTDYALEWIRAQRSPWFAWLAYAAPHAPFHVPPAHLTRRKVTPGSSIRERYLAAIEALDSELGRLLAGLDAQTRSRTMVIYVGDNGTPGRVTAERVGRTRRHKGTLFESGIRVPPVVSRAGATRHGEREPALVHTVDLFATVAELAGATKRRLHDSKSSAKLLSNRDSRSREFNYTEFRARQDGWLSGAGHSA